jgi:DNA-binding response OmpR family regulator
MIMAQSILAIDDSVEIHRLLDVRLRNEGLIIHHALNAEDGLAKARELQPDLILLDVVLPSTSGFALCRTLKEDPRTAHVPIIFLTGTSDMENKVAGLDLGATDYVTKPFAFEELLARIRARLRESGDASETILDAAGIRLDLLTREATRGDRVARLPDREAELLAYLMRHSDRVCRREEILAGVWDYEHDPGTNVVQVYVGYLRRKLGRPGSPAPIETVRSVGYRLSERG